MANPEMHYDGEEIVYLNDIDPDYMSVIELREMLRPLQLPNNIPDRYKVADGDFRVITNDDQVFEMFVVFRDEPNITLYVGDIVADINGPYLWGLDKNGDGNPFPGNLENNFVNGVGNADIENAGIVGNADMLVM